MSNIIEEWLAEIIPDNADEPLTEEARNELLSRKYSLHWFAREMLKMKDIDLVPGDAIELTVVMDFQGQKWIIAGGALQIRDPDR